MAQPVVVAQTLFSHRFLYHRLRAKLGVIIILHHGSSSEIFLGPVILLVASSTTQALFKNPTLKAHKITWTLLTS